MAFEAVVNGEWELKGTADNGKKLKGSLNDSGLSHRLGPRLFPLDHLP